jgi:hypothetical protein
MSNFINKYNWTQVTMLLTFLIRVIKLLPKHSVSKDQSSQPNFNLLEFEMKFGVQKVPI